MAATGFAAVTEWRDVPGYEGRYQVSDDGQVLSLPRKGSRGRMLKLAPFAHGYRVVNLSLEGATRTRLVHHLVLLAFIGPRPDSAVTRHLDGNPANNVLSNLDYGTCAENAADMRRHGTNRNLRKTHCPQGHPYAGVNLFIGKTGNRGCRICRRAQRYEATLRARRA